MDDLRSDQGISSVDVVTRLAALAQYDILDTPSEPDYDDIVHVAQKIADTPVALISFVDLNRQWFKARVGFAPCQTSLDQSVCAHALKQDDILVIPDLRVDPRTWDNSLVTGDPHIRFYAGAVLKTPQGIAVGTLCVIDIKPRPDGLAPEQADALRALARQTMAMMAMRRAVSERVDALVLEREARRAEVERARAMHAETEHVRLDEARSRLAQEAGGIGTFDVEYATNRCFVSAEFCRIYGLPASPEQTVAGLQDMILDADRSLASMPRSRFDAGAPHYAEYRIRRRSDAAIRWIGRRSMFHADANGIVRRMIGVVQDVTERKLVETRRSALIRFGEDLAAAASPQDVMILIGRTVGETLELLRAGFCQVDGGSGLLMIGNDWRQPATRGVAGQYPMGVLQKTLDQMEIGTPVVIANHRAASWMASDSAWLEAMGTRSSITAPLVDHGKLVAFVFAHAGKPRTWSAGEVDFVQAIADRGFAVIGKIQAEQHQRLLNEELSHRLKNTLSMVQAIAGQTLRFVENKEAVKAFDDRIIALSRAHDVLLQQNWSAARIGSVIESVSSLHARADQIEAAGPNLSLGAKATLSLSLLLHELATNSLKYGALSCNAGRVALTWHVDEDEVRGPALVLVWEERAGPVAEAPTRRGFGTRLISMGLAGTGNARLDYRASGLRAEFRAALSKISED